MKIKKIIIIVLILLLVISISNMVFSKDVDISQFKGTKTDTSTMVEEKSNQIIGIIQVMAATSAVILLIYLGIRYMMAAPSERVDIKKSFAIYIVGAVCLFSTTGILQIIKNFAKNI